MWFELSDVERVTDEQRFPVRKVTNGSTEKPEYGAFLIYPRSKAVPFGHVAVVSEVGENFIRVVEQNYSFHRWSGDFAREIPMIFRDGKYFLEDFFEIYGWIDVIGKEELTPFDPSELDVVRPKYRAGKPVGQIQRLFASAHHDESNDRFSMENEGNLLTYFKADEDFLCNLSGTSNEIYRLLMLATDRVIRSDDLLTDFRIPEAFWSPIRRSWSDASLPDLLGHCDWIFDGLTLKLTDYRSDDTSTLLNSVVQQEKSVENLRVQFDFSSTFQFHRVFVRQWKRLELRTTVHILIEDEREEMLTALYMQSVLKEAYVESKICLVQRDLRWENEWITDDDGEIVKVVWAMWKWEKIFEDYRSFHHFGPTPQLSDVLLDENIRVIEPPWKSISNHRAMLAVLNQMFPNHPNLSEKRWINAEDEDESARWLMNEESIVDPMFTFDEDPFVEDLPKQKTEVQIVSWMIRGLFSGFLVRDDEPEKSEGVCCVI